MNRKAIVAICLMAAAVLTTSCHVRVNKTVTHSKVTKTYSGTAVKPFDRIIIDAFCDVRRQIRAGRFHQRVHQLC